MTVDVEIHRRRAMTYGEKLRRWDEVGRVCMVCKLPCAPAGPDVIWDHRVPLAIGGTNDLANMEPHHAGGCAKRKTAQDARTRAKVNRLRKTAENAERPSGTAPAPRKRHLRSRGFQTRLRKRMDGTVEPR